MLVLIYSCILAFSGTDEPALAPLIPLLEQHKGMPPIRWAGSRLDEARQEAVDRRVPILLWVIRDGDPSSQAWADQRLRDPEFILTLEKETVPALVCLAAADGQRHSQERIRDTKESPARSRCPVLRNCNCEGHLGSEPLLENLEIPKLLPAAFLISFSGEVTAVPQEIPFQGTVGLAIYLAEKQQGERSTRLNLEFLKIRLERAKSCFERREIRIGRLELVHIESQLDQFGSRIRSKWEIACQPYLAYGNQMLIEAKRIGRKDFQRRLMMLRRLVQQLEGMPPATTAQRFLDQALPN
ncbi:MAG: hypothetical protein OSB09_04525 [Planctomycetota bacterium]|nr:hypothetical protein [Planctomycetota bacterium]